MDSNALISELMAYGISTVSLQEELEFLDRYLALLQERFGEGIQVRIAPDVADLQGTVPPAALQMLIENAIKHNEHTREHPLIVEISASGNGICVSNPKRLLPKTDSTSVGQHNIVERYRLLTRKDEQSSAQRLKRLLEASAISCEVIGMVESNAAAKAFFAGKHPAIDLILSDIQLGDGLSFEALRCAPADIPVIFTTAYDQYAVQAFKFNSLDYLLKPNWTLSASFA